MAKGEIILKSDKKWEGLIKWSSEANISGNYSELYVKATMWKTDDHLTSSNDPTEGTITIDGKPYDLKHIYEFDEDAVTIFEDTIQIFHNSDGTKSLFIELTCDGQPDTTLNNHTLGGSDWITLDTIPRTAKLSASSGTLGEEQTLTITSDSDSFGYGIYYEYNGEWKEIALTTDKSVKWTPPLELASLNTTGNSVTVNLWMGIYSWINSAWTQVSEHQINVFYNIGSAVAPTFTVDFSDDAGYKDIYGDYLQLRSRLKVKVNPTTYYGAEITSCKITVQGITYTDTEAIASEVNAYGDIQVNVYIQDSRGKTAQKYFYVYFRQYSLPCVSSLTVKRCDADGRENSQGEYVQAKFTAYVSSLTDATTEKERNTAKYQFGYKKTTDESYTMVTLTEHNNELFVSGETYMFAAETGSSYDVLVIVTDAFSSESKKTIASTAATIMHFKASGKGIGLGKVAEVEDAIDMGWNVNMNSNRIMNVGDPENDSDAVSRKYLEEYFLDNVYPVGSIYLAYNDTNPASIFGGTWERLQGILTATVPENGVAIGDTFPVTDLNSSYWVYGISIAAWRRIE